MTKHLKTCLSGTGSSNKTQNTNTNNLISGGSSGVDVSKNLQNLSSRRPDIFGG